MPSLRSLTLLALAAVLAQTAPADAQMFGRRKPARTESGPPHVDCDMVAANPNSGMDKATCEQMNQAEAAYYAAQHDPAGARPGDDQMTCKDIEAEFMGQPVTPPPTEHVAAAQAATGELMQKTAKEQAEAQAIAAQESAAATAASAIGVANPIAGRAAQQAVDAAATATQKAFNAKAEAEMRPVTRKTMSATAALVGDATQQIESDPRIARLMALSQEKHCHGWQSSN